MIRNFKLLFTHYKYFYDLFIKDYPKIVAIHVSETPKTWATYRK